MILVTCTISSFIVEKASRAIALQQESEPDKEVSSEKILISLAYPDKVNDLIDLGILLKPPKSNIPIYALHVVEENSLDETKASGKKMIEKALKHAIASDTVITPLTRHDINISNGIIYTIKENNITDVVIGLHQNARENDFLGVLSERILRHVLETIYVYKAKQPLNTLKRMIVVVPAKAELEPGFIHWFDKLTSLAKVAGLPIVFYAQSDTIPYLQKANNHNPQPVNAQYHEFHNWDDFLIFSREVKVNDLFVIISSRKGYISYQPQLDRLPHYLARYFADNSFIILYPKQLEHGLRMEDVQHVDTALIDTLSGNTKALKKAGRYFKGFFKGREKP